MEQKQWPEICQIQSENCRDPVLVFFFFFTCQEQSLNDFTYVCPLMMAAYICANHIEVYISSSCNFMLLMGSFSVLSCDNAVSVS